MPGTPMACLFIMFAMIMWIAVPSRGAILASELAASMPPVPGMLRGTMRRVAGNEASEMPRQEPDCGNHNRCPRSADDQADLLALYKSGDGRRHVRAERACEADRRAARALTFVRSFFSSDSGRF